MSSKASRERHLPFLFVIILLFFSAVAVASKPGNLHSQDVRQEYARHGDSQALVGPPAQDIAFRPGITYLPHSTTEHSITIDYDNPGKAEKTDSLLRDLIKARSELWRSSVREISVKGGGHYGNWTLVNATFHSLHNLETVYWHNDQPIPPIILESLETFNPLARLHYHAQFRNTIVKQKEGAGSRINAHKSIVSSTNLYSFTADIDYDHESNRQDDLGLAWLVLKTCPNVRELDLKIGWSGCLSGLGQPNSFDFSSDPGARLAPLEVLKLNGYDLESTSNKEWVEAPEFGTYPDDDTDEWNVLAEALRVMRIQQKSKESPMMDIQAWLDAMDWSKMHTLHLHDVSLKVLRLLSGSILPSLKRLSLTGTHGDESKSIAIGYQKYLNNTVLPLESIAFQYISQLEPDSLLDVIQAHHKSSLKHLKLTGTSSKIGEPQAPRLHTAAPSLETLDIDMARPPADAQAGKSQWDTPLLSALAAHPSLQHLTLRIPAPEPDPDESFNGEYLRARDFYGYMGRADGVEDKLVNHTSVAELFTYLRENKAEFDGEDGGAREGIRELEVFVGDYEWRYEFGLGGAPRDVLGRYMCRVNGDGGIVCEGEATQNVCWG